MPQRPESVPELRRRMAAVVAEIGKSVDFGKTASDYGRFRAGFPDQFFEKLQAIGVMRAGMRALDLGCGTGTVARAMALRGCIVTGLDQSPAMTGEAARIDRELGATVEYVNRKAEDTGLPAASFDLVTAGQCWHWFDNRRACREVLRLLKSGGRLVIGNFDWIPLPGNVAEATEKLIEAHNPSWKLGGGYGFHPWWAREMAIAGFKSIESFSFDIDSMYTHEAWRGRIRASAGIGATLAPDAVAKFDAELATLLAERFPADPMPVLHRVFAVIGTAP